YDLTQSVDVEVDGDLLRFLQTSAQNERPKPPPLLGRWVISWKGKVETGGDKKEQARFIVQYDFDGKLVGLEQSLPPAKESRKLLESEAFDQARSFLASMKVDTSTLALSKRETSVESEQTKYSYTFTRASAASADWKENFEVEITGAEVTKYSASLEREENLLKESKFEKISDTVSAVLVSIVWVVVSIFLLAIFFRRLRHDELEFKRAIWFGVAFFVLMWLIVAIQSMPEWAGVLLGGGFAGLFTGGGMLIAYAANESLQREVWKEKLAVTDLLFRGYWRLKEVGQGLLNAFFIVGVTLLLYGAAHWLANFFNLGYLTVESGDLWILQGQTRIITILAGTFITGGFIYFLFLAFWPTYLRSKIRSRVGAMLLAGLFFSLCGFHLQFLRPPYLAWVLMLPVAMLWIYFADRHDLLTMFISLVAFNYFLKSSLLMVAPEGIWSAAGTTTIIVAVVVFVAGVYFVYSRNSVKDFEGYIPAYVSRIAERERFLKELEIARSIQMRFLPATAPQFPKLEIACLCRPAMEVGGDYYDFICNDDHRLSVVVGDVSGKGVSAAFFMTMAKGIIKALSKMNLSPKHLLADMNTVFYENTPKEVFISLIYGLFNIQQSTLTVARAGHNPLIVRKRVGGAPELLTPRGLAIGLEKGDIFSATIEEQTIPIQHGDVFVFYTDGVSESVDKNGDEFGEERLVKLIGERAHESAQALLETITTEVKNFTGEMNQRDDLTMVVVKVVG
ncbi:MAG: SpoIIE family protein phosphatase, partial [candidate division KSB1 bacterium]|nr:SpoIIE family protein phosphatase [candidate division KSB1 bacterium]